MRVAGNLLCIALLPLTFACDVIGPRDGRPHALWILDTGLVLEPGESFAFEAVIQEHGSRGSRPGSEHVTPANARWWTDQPHVLSVPDPADGTVHALEPGEAVVWVEVGARRDSATVSVLAPDAVRPSRRWMDVSNWGTSTCALDQRGDAYCWGTNAFGELGNGPRRFRTYTHRPVRVDAPVTFVQIEVGSTVACGRTVAGEIWCWGNHLGSRLGHGRTSVDFEERPVRVAFEGKATALALGATHACLLDQHGRAHCWGSNLSFQLGTDLDILSSRERGGRTVPVAFDGTFVAIDARTFSTCGTTAQKEIYCWGLLANVEVPLPTRVVTPTEPVQVSPASGGSCYIDESGQIYCWGLLFILRPTGFSENPIAMETDIRFSQIAGRCGLDRSGQAWCWGPEGMIDPQATNESCGTHSTSMCSFDPVPVPGGHHFRSLSVVEAACGITSDDALYCWGVNEHGQLGIGRPQVEQTHIPQRVLDPR